MDMRRTLTLLPLLCLTAAAADADLIESTPSGFTIRTSVDVAATPRMVYHALNAQVSNWWDPEHTWSGNPRNMSIDARAGGCFCEKLTSGGTVAHMTVVLADPGKTLRMSGALGPLQEHAIVGTMTWMLSEAGVRTTVEMTYVVGGYMRGGVEPVVKIVDQVLGGQVQRLKRYIESGPLR
jgi:uncharacterized protein YndB with AHSA1/START domain